jgi:hypothetical protein
MRDQKVEGERNHGRVVRRGKGERREGSSRSLCSLTPDPFRTMPESFHPSGRNGGAKVMIDCILALVRFLDRLCGGRNASGQCLWQ